MARNAYMVGSLVRATGTFKVGATLTDPTTVTAVIRNPAGIQTVYVYLTDAQLVRDSAGVYHVDVNAATAGRWTYRFAGTGAAQAAGERVFIVSESEV